MSNLIKAGIAPIGEGCLALPLEVVNRRTGFSAFEFFIDQAAVCVLSSISSGAVRITDSVAKKLLRGYCA